MPLILNGSTGISGADGSAGTPAVQGTDNNTGMFFPAADQIAFAEGGVEAMRIDASGNVGIGTSVPISKLHVAGGSGSTIRNTASSGSSWFVGSNVDSYILHNESNTPMLFTTNGTERARIASGGQFLVGTTSNFGSAVAGTLQVAAADVQLWLRHSSTSAGQFWRMGPDGNNNIVVYNQNGTGVFMTNGGTAWVANSDERLKADLKPIESAAQKVSTLRAVTGRYKADEPGTRRAFLIAQDVQAVLPEAVSVQGDEQGTLGLAYTDVIPLLTAALQEALTEIAALKARVAALEAR